ncbi:GNAT family N-acetyltransferase [Sphingomonas sp. LR60]|uniref:GNAT family N-acetyltransferase n=1 Tax=Sphingomonas sp. LR60 TaxID=3050233 RepID=UPI002FE21A74
MITDAIAWRVERACAAAYPPRESLRVDGWLVACSGGGSRRSNSASATRPDATLDAATLAAISNRYDAAALPTIVRVTGLAPGLTAMLDAAGFDSPEGQTRTLSRALDSSGESVGEVIVTNATDASWLAARRRLTAAIEDPAAVATRIVGPVGYARIGEGEATAAIGYVAIHDQIAVLEAIATDPAVRRQGHARSIVTTLLAWAAGQGARHAALQVEAGNVAARALYAGLGFTNNLYGYHYRRRAASLGRAPRLGSTRS